MNAFQAFYSKRGDLYITDGVVMQARRGVIKLVGSGTRFSANLPDNAGADFTLARMASGSTFVGGSGRNYFLNGLPAPTSAAPSPTGWLMPREEDVFTNGIFRLTVSGPSSAEIHDGTNVVAILTTGGLAPEGDYASTVYGAATYHATVAFTLTCVPEIAGGGAIPDAVASVSAGSAMEGLFVPLSADLYEHDTDADWTLEIAPDGSAAYRYLGDEMATRADGSPSDPAGVYQATALGMATFNLTADEPVDGEPWSLHVSVNGRLSRAGYAYLQLTAVSGYLTTVAGPFFATTLPANSGETFHFPLARCDGSSIEQYHTGLLLWPDDEFVLPSAGLLNDDGSALLNDDGNPLLNDP